MKRCVLLLSGGLDSTTALAIAKASGFSVHALTVKYGQRHDAELKAASRVAVAMGVAEHRFVGVDLGLFGGSALTSDIEVPKDRDEAVMGASIPATYVPARNTVMLSLALAYAEVVGANDIFVGVNAVDFSGYPDCRPEFIEAFERMSQLATKVGVEGGSMTIHAPLIDLNKREIILKGLELGVDYSLTHSCYDPGDDDQACGHCDACLLRLKAFRGLGLADPAFRQPVQ